MSLQGGKYQVENNGRCIWSDTLPILNISLPSSLSFHPSKFMNITCNSPIIIQSNPSDLKIENE
jgi:hypothetical protein